MTNHLRISWITNLLQVTVDTLLQGILDVTTCTYYKVVEWWQKNGKIYQLKLYSMEVFMNYVALKI